MTKEKTKILLFVVAILLTLVAGIVLTFTTNSVYADTNNTSQIVNFNQLFYRMSSGTVRRFNSSTGITYNSDNSVTLDNNGLVSTYNYDYGVQFYNHNFSYVNGHKYYISLEVQSTYEGYINFELWYSYSSLPQTDAYKTVANVNKRYEYISTCGRTVTQSTQLIYVHGGPSNIDGVSTFRNVMVIDLTAMYGVGFEPANVDSFRDVFNSPFYDYNIGTLVNISQVDYQNGYDAGYRNGQLNSSDNKLVFVNGLNTFLNGEPNTLSSLLNNDGSYTYTNFQDIGSGDNVLYCAFSSSALMKPDTTYKLSFDYFECDASVAGFKLHINGGAGSNTADLLVSSSNSYTNFQYVFTTRSTFNFNELYFIFHDATYVTLKNFTVLEIGSSAQSYQQGYASGYYDGENAARESFGAEYEQEIADLKANYEPGGNGYITIFNKGRDHEADVQNNFTFKRLFTAVIEAPVQAILDAFDLDIPILDINLKSFILALFTTMVVIVILRVALAR